LLCLELFSLCAPRGFFQPDQLTELHAELLIIRFLPSLLPLVLKNLGDIILLVLLVGK
jgi:hypothetical protein